MNDIFFANVKGHAVILDAEFAEDFDPDRWRVSDNKRGHRYVEADGVHRYGKPKCLVQLHRVVSLAKRGEHVDHVNGLTLDNRRINLRICSRGENSRNRTARHDCKSGLKGVYYRPPNSQRRTKNGVWVASIGATVDGKFRRIHLGHFKTAEEAALAYNEAATKYHGEFANLNSV